MSECVYVCECMVNVCIWVCVCECMRVSVCICICECMCECVFMSMCVYVCMHTRFKVDQIARVHQSSPGSDLWMHFIHHFHRGRSYKKRMKVENFLFN